MTAAQNKKETDDADHGTISGTSMATPHAVSAVAILKSYNQNLNLEDTIKLLKKHSIHLGRDGRDDYYGYGLITFINAQFCEEGSDDHDEYNVFKNSDTSNENLEIVKITDDLLDEGDKIYYVTNNYGNITNLMNAKLRLYFNEDSYITKQLFDLEGVEITNYDSNVFYNQDTKEGIQEVNIKYRGLSTTMKVATYDKSGWEYEIIEDDKARITGINYQNSEAIFPRILYIPEYLFPAFLYL